MIRAEQRPSWWAITLLAVVLGFGWLGTRGLGEPDETRYALVAHEMRASGGWLAPTLHGAPHLTKPPLTYWSVALGQQLLGSGPWGSRLFLGIVFALTIGLVARFGEVFWEDPRGRWAGVIYATTLSPFVAASLVTTDTLLVLWETAALLAFWCAWKAPEARARRAWRAGAWASLGAAFLTKGPPGLLPLLLVLVFRWLRPRAEPRPRVLSLLGLALFGLIGLPWYGVVAGAYPGLVEHFVGYELYRRIFVGLPLRHGGWIHPFAIYGPVLVAGSLPWLLLLPAAPRRLWRLARRVRWRASPRARLAAVWILLTIVLFTLSSSRQYLYVLPVFPALALVATGACLKLGGGRFLRPARAGIVVLVACVGLLGLRWGAAQYPSHRDARRLAAPLASVVGPETDLVVVGRPLHGFDLQLAALGRLAGRTAPPVGGACDVPEAAPSAELLAGLERRRVYVADGDALERLQRRLEPAEASGRVRCRDPFGPTRTQAVVCDPVGGPSPHRRRVALLLDAAESGTVLHELACRVRRLSDQRRFGALHVLTDAEVRGAWRRRWLPPRLNELLWWLPSRGIRLERLPTVGPGGDDAGLEGLSLRVERVSGERVGYGLRIGAPDSTARAEVHLTAREPLLLLEWGPDGAGRALRAGPHGELTPLARWPGGRSGRPPEQHGAGAEGLGGGHQLP